MLSEQNLIEKMAHSGFPDCDRVYYYCYTSLSRSTRNLYGTGNLNNSGLLHGTVGTTHFLMLKLRNSYWARGAFPLIQMQCKGKNFGGSCRASPDNDNIAVPALPVCTSSSARTAKRNKVSASVSASYVYGRMSNIIKRRFVAARVGGGFSNSRHK